MTYYKKVDGKQMEMSPAEAATFEAAREVDPVAALTAKREASSMSRRDFAVLSAKQGWITEVEAKTWAGGNDIPAIAAVAIATLAVADRFEMEMSVLTRSAIWRTDPLVLVLMSIKGVTPEEMDVHFNIV